MVLSGTELHQISLHLGNNLEYFVDTQRDCAAHGSRCPLSIYSNLLLTSHNKSQDTSLHYLALRFIKDRNQFWVRRVLSTHTFRNTCRFFFFFSSLSHKHLSFMGQMRIKNCIIFTSASEFWALGSAKVVLFPRSLHHNCHRYRWHIVIYTYLCKITHICALIQSCSVLVIHSHYYDTKWWMWL